MLMTNLKMDPPAPQKRAMSRKHVLGSKLQGSQLQTGDQTSDFLGPDTQAVDDWWTEKITLLAVAVLHLQPWSPSCVWRPPFNP